MRPPAFLLVACALAAFPVSAQPRGAEAGGAPAVPARPAPEAEPEPTPEATAERRPVKVSWEAPSRLRKLFEEFVPGATAEPGERFRASLRPWMRDARRLVTQIAAAEGYFSPTIDFVLDEEKMDRVTVKVEAGARTEVKSVAIDFDGDIARAGGEREARRETLRGSWSLRPGEPMVSDAWERAKTEIQESLSAVDYAAARIASSEARVDAEAATAALSLGLDSGPPFTLGEVRIEGLKEYPETVVRRLTDVKPGERYTQERLNQLQRRIQDGWWFSSVVVEIPRDPAAPERVPVTIRVAERPRMEVGTALGFGTDDGARGEVSFRHRDFLDRGFDLQSSLRVAQKRQIGYADVYLPPGLWFTETRGNIPYTDSVGVLAEHSDFENLDLSRLAVAGYRHLKLDDFEFRMGLSYQIERSKPLGDQERLKRALAPIFAVTWRRVDDIFDPKKGGVLAVQVAAGQKSLASGDDFFKVYAQYQHWFPVTPDDQLIVRTEIGRTFTGGPERIPEDFLFRAGGSRSNRGYAYQSLGVQRGQAVVGGRYLFTGSADFVHWLNDKWGAAVFADVGDASDSRDDWDTNLSYGVGARFKTPAGPLAIDLAYAHKIEKFRLAFSVSIAF